MTKKTLYLLIAIAGILLAGIVTAVTLLYSDRGKKTRPVETGQFIEHHQLIEAVPSDAAIVFCMKDFGRACDLLLDTVAVFRELSETCARLLPLSRSITARTCRRFLS